MTARCTGPVLAVRPPTAPEASPFESATTELIFPPPTPVESVRLVTPSGKSHVVAEGDFSLQKLTNHDPAGADKDGVVWALLDPFCSSFPDATTDEPLDPR